MTVSKPPALVVGTGFGCRIPLPALRAAGFDVVGIVGTDTERTARRAQTSGVRQAFTDLDEAIARTGAVAVVIATPPHTHAPLTYAALSRGCHVICEKPFAKNTSEARAMLDAAEHAGVAHLVGHEFRWSPERATLARAIAEGLIGRPRFITFTHYASLVASLETKMPPWWFDTEAGGGWLGASGSHVIDQVRSSLGEFESLSAVLPMVSARAEKAAEDSFILRFRLANGAEGVLQQTAGAWGPNAGMTRVAGTQGTLWEQGGAVWIADRNGSRELPVPPDLALPPPPAPVEGQRFSQVGLGPYTRLCEAFRAVIDGNVASNVVPLPTFADGLAEMEVLDAIRSSAASDGALVIISSSSSR
jgi:predicted dehydrogenase